MTVPLSMKIGGYVLAGGRSARMGQDKALLELAGRPLVARAVTKLQNLCAEVHILSRDLELAAFGPLVPDLHPDTGPMGGVEAALLHTPYDWNLILPVDAPFLPVTFLRSWTTRLEALQTAGARLSLYTTYGVQQPTVLLIHREMAPYLSAAIDRGTYKLNPILQAAAADLAERQGIARSCGFDNPVLDAATNLDDLVDLTEQQRSHADLWFANLNHPEEFAEAQQLTGLLDA